MTKNIKLGFTKSKAYGLCGIILSTALFSLMAGTVSADEVTAPQPATETVATASTTEPAATETTTAAKTEETPTINKAATEVTKDGTTISVKNPEVDMHFEKSDAGNGTGKYNNFKVEYKDIKFPDSMTINEGDKVVFTMPEEVSFRTDFDFDVKNPADETIGHANASVKDGTVTTVFNDYFSKHPLNKEMSMTFDAKWTEKVTSGEVTRPNFNGAVKEVNVDPEPELDPGTEKFSKWGSQAEEDAQTLKWTIRFNLAKDKLENIILKDRWSSNQEYVDGSLELRTIEDVKTWTGDVSAQEYLDAFHVMNGGFDLKLKTLQKLMYINYRTRLKTPVKESTDPVNAVWLTVNAGDKLADNYRAHISLAGGKGRASGEAEEIPTPEPEEPNTPTDPKEETPKETPKEEEKPKETPKETPKEEEKPKETPKETPKEEEKPKETPKEEEKPKETPKETPKDEEKPKEDKPKEEEKPKEDQPKDEEKPKEDKPKEDKPKEDKPKEDKPKEDKPKEDEKPKEDKPQPEPEPQPEPQPQPRPVPVPKPDLRRREVPKDEPRKQEVTKEVPTPENKKSENSESKEIKSIGKIVNHRLRSLPKTGTVLSATLSVLGVIGMIIGLKMKRSTEE